MHDLEIRHDRLLRPGRGVQTAHDAPPYRGRNAVAQRPACPYAAVLPVIDRMERRRVASLDARCRYEEFLAGRSQLLTRAVYVDELG